jgi:hypothetical protein
MTSALAKKLAIEIKEKALSGIGIWLATRLEMTNDEKELAEHIEKALHQARIEGAKAMQVHLADYVAECLEAVGLPLGVDSIRNIDPETVIKESIK